MTATALDHVTVVTKDLQASRDFYIGVLGLEEADFRPDFPFDGAWLKLGERAVVHLVVMDDRDRGDGNTQPFDHFALRAQNMQGMRKTLGHHGITWEEAAPPNSTIRQFFLFDPDGVQIELTFDATAEERAGTL
jgi:catechol 2,3-dioxygenase-like lactoylglutathione lyase family enzyme